MFRLCCCSDLDGACLLRFVLAESSSKFSNSSLFNCSSCGVPYTRIQGKLRMIENQVKLIRGAKVSSLDSHKGFFFKALRERLLLGDRLLSRRRGRCGFGGAMFLFELRVGQGDGLVSGGNRRWWGLGLRGLGSAACILSGLRTC